MGEDICSACGAAFEHNSHIFGGCDLYGRPAIVGDCCSENLVQVTSVGIYAARSYDFLHPRKREIDSRPNRPVDVGEITSAIAAYRGWIEETDRQVDGMARRAGVRGLAQINVLETAWKTDDRLWFEQNPERSHRARLVFPGEADEAARTPTGTVLLMLIRQVEPGKRVRAGFFLNAELWPAPEIEAIAHLLFDIATGQQAQPRDAAERSALVEQYRAAGRGH